MGNELSIGTIEGKNIIAIYEIAEEDENYIVLNSYKNPHLTEEISPRFQIDEEIIFNSDDGQNTANLYNLGCEKLPIDTTQQRSALYKNYTDFMEQYTSEKYITDQAKLNKDYFQGRETYTEDFYYGPAGECDLKLECCI